ncbi:DNA polymerase III subunit delta' [Bacillus solimangrovi]|uniref:DNA polymerase III subunit delta' n=1 Tax=Bacillus solimangrovi TaxID=1305675 RepID=A0A1E5LC86_9BACI|nr:DNA polymerase III subunit delta' [Bacillus solimangrovi]OEH91696.1 DNA polymerase III subunit delta' [Bacillus solimangrovi]
MHTWNEYKTFQPIVVQMLTNAIKKDRIAHAYLFEGGRGTGKKEMSLQLAKSLMCENCYDTEPCGTCRNCQRISSGNHPDVHVLTPEGQSLKKEQILFLQQEFSKTGVESNKKIYILEHADRMTIQAANSLLKFLEEPSSDTTAILLTEQAHRMLDTILSRCQKLSFKPLPSELLIEKLVKQDVPLKLAKTVANITNNLTEALSLLENDWFAQARKLVIQLTEALNQRSEFTLIWIHNHWVKFFQDRVQLNLGLDLLLLWYKDLLYMQAGEEEKIVYIDQQEMIKQEALRVSQQTVAQQLTAILMAKKRIHSNMNAQLLMEQLVLRLQEG